MKRITINALVDIGCLVTFIPSLVSGLVLFFVLPEGGFRSGWAVYLGLTRREWIGMHNTTSLAFAALLIIHLLLHGKFFFHIGRHLRPGTAEEPGATDMEQDNACPEPE
jgi:hypothetical protein